MCVCVCVCRHMLQVLSAIQVYRFCKMCQGITSSPALVVSHVTAFETAHVMTQGTEVPSRLKRGALSFTKTC